MYETIAVAHDDRGIATLTLDRPAKHNALDGVMIGELTEAARALGRDPAVRAIVLTGAGQSFCAGADLGWMKAQIGADAAVRRREATALATMLNVVNSCPRPVIGRIQGNAFGGGVGLAAVCDVAIGAEGARFGFTETRLGLIPATIGPYVIARMGPARARRVFMSSRIFGAQEAVRLGVIARSVPPEALDEAVLHEVEPYLACAPGAVAEAKALALRLGPPVDEGVIAESVAALLRRWESAEAGEGVAAFLEKRSPGWAR